MTKTSHSCWSEINATLASGGKCRWKKLKTAPSSGECPTSRLRPKPGNMSIRYFCFFSSFPNGPPTLERKIPLINGRFDWPILFFLVTTNDLSVVWPWRRCFSTWCATSDRGKWTRRKPIQASQNRPGRNSSAPFFRKLDETRRIKKKKKKKSTETWKNKERKWKKKRSWIQKNKRGHTQSHRGLFERPYVTAREVGRIVEVDVLAFIHTTVFAQRDKLFT